MFLKMGNYVYILIIEIILADIYHCINIFQMNVHILTPDLKISTTVRFKVKDYIIYKVICKFVH